MNGERQRSVGAGFTLIELLVVMAVVALLATIAAPRYFEHLDRARENTLKQSLAVMRDAIDKFHADTNHYPETLEELAAKRYLRAVPRDPVTEQTDSWVIVPPQSGIGVYDVRSGAAGETHDGTPFGEL